MQRFPISRQYSKKKIKQEKMQKKDGTGIPRFTLLMWGHKKKTPEAKTT